MLCDMNREWKAWSAKKQGVFPSDEIIAFEKRYQELIGKVGEENKKTKHRSAKKDEKTLLNRMERCGHNHLLCIHDFAVPHDNNVSERDLRKRRTAKRELESFCKERGDEMYYAILSNIERLTRRKKAMFENIKRLFMGIPVFLTGARPICSTRRLNCYELQSIHRRTESVCIAE